MFTENRTDLLSPASITLDLIRGPPWRSIGSTGVIGGATCVSTISPQAVARHRSMN